ncbi:MAG: hypothetical protein M3R61_03435 [Chloroflexota bacterium]|nr:hypothetical protein [Chloroflexota bacterium]
MLIGFLAALLLAPAASAATTIVQPQAGPPGTRFLFFTDGFAADEPISIWLNAPDGRVIAAEDRALENSSASGAATWTWTAPANATLGTWQMVGHGRRSGNEQIIPFTIGQPAPSDIGGQGQPFNVVPADGVPGTLFRFFATGFEPREFVYVAVNGPSGTLKAPSLTVPRTADPTGRVDGSWTSPTDAALGAYQIVIQSDHSGVTRTIPLSIHAAQANQPPQLTVTPAAAAPGARFVFSGTGFGANEKLSIWLNTPDGRVLPTEIEGVAEAAPDGRVAWTWVAPKDAQLGAWQLVAHGRTSGIELVVGFTLQ